MKTTIFYFSATGNSFQVAQDIALELGDTEIISIPKLMDRNEIIVNTERIGVVYPVYMFGMPLIVIEFLKRLKLNSSHYIFAVATYGGKAGSSLLETKNLLNTMGLKLSAGFLVMMPGNYTPLYGAITQEKQQEMFDKEKQKVKVIVDAIKEEKEMPPEKDSPVFNLIFSGLLRSVCLLRIHKMDKSFWADEKCNGCGVCVKVCPVGDIKMSEKRPSWLGKCEQCMGCLQWCPQEAIQFGKNTSGRKRYRNPRYSLKDFIRSEQ